MKKLNILIISLIVILFIILIIFFINKKDNNIDPKLNVNDIIFNLKGDNYIELEDIKDYIEYGYNANLKDGTDLSKYVIINKNKIEESDNYIIEYKLVYKNIKMELTRNIIIKNNIESDINITLNGESVVYILKGNDYIESGAIAISSIDGDISKDIKVNNNIDINNIGEYYVDYNILDSNNNSSFIRRRVIIYDYNYDLKIDRLDNKVNIVFTDNSDYVDYLLIDNIKYKVDSLVNYIEVVDDKNYNIKIYDKYGYIKETNINLVKPKFTCSATLSLNRTTINVTNISGNISKYIYYFDNKYYESNKNSYSLSNYYSNMSVIAYDINNNSSKEVCSVTNNVPYFESGLKTLKYSNWNYYLYVPSNTRQSEKKSLVVFLHGSGEAGSNIKSLDSYGFSKYIKAGNSYDTFILMPQLNKNEVWNTDANRLKLFNLIEQVVKDYNVDKSRISIGGFSLGTIGIPNMLKERPNYFSAVVLIALCGNGSESAKYLKDIPTRVFAGSKDTTMGNSRKANSFVNALKEINNDVEFTVYQNYEHNVVDKALKDGKVLEWMVSKKNKY